MTRSVPKSVFVPFEWTGTKWIKRDDLPRFKEVEEPILFWTANPQVLFRDGAPLHIVWQERDERVLIEEYLQGVGVLRS